MSNRDLYLAGKERLGARFGADKMAADFNVWEDHRARLTWLYGEYGARQRLNGDHMGDRADIAAWGRIGRLVQDDLL